LLKGDIELVGGRKPSQRPESYSQLYIIYGPSKKSCCAISKMMDNLLWINAWKQYFGFVLQARGARLKKLLWSHLFRRRRWQDVM